MTIKLCRASRPLHTSCGSSTKAALQLLPLHPDRSQQTDVAQHFSSGLDATYVCCAAVAQIRQITISIDSAWSSVHMGARVQALRMHMNAQPVFCMMAWQSDQLQHCSSPVTNGSHTCCFSLLTHNLPGHVPQQKLAPVQGYLVIMKFHVFRLSCLDFWALVVAQLRIQLIHSHPLHH